MTRIVAGLGLLLLAGCGVEWFPENPPFNNLSTVLQNRTTAKLAPIAPTQASAEAAVGDGAPGR